jgi:hypothetical protein
MEITPERKLWLEEQLAVAQAANAASPNECDAMLVREFTRQLAGQPKVDTEQDEADWANRHNRDDFVHGPRTGP